MFGFGDAFFRECPLELFAAPSRITQLPRDVIFVQFVVANQEAHINATVKEVEHQVEVQTAGQFTAIDAAVQRLVSLLAPRPQESARETLPSVADPTGHRRSQPLRCGHCASATPPGIGSSAALMSRQTEPLSGNAIRLQCWTQMHRRPERPCSATSGTRWFSHAGIGSNGFDREISEPGFRSNFNVLRRMACRDRSLRGRPGGRFSHFHCYAAALVEKRLFPA